MSLGIKLPGEAPKESNYSESIQWTLYSSDVNDKSWLTLKGAMTGCGS